MLAAAEVLFLALSMNATSNSGSTFLSYKLGHSTSHFLKQGAKVLCVEGSHDAVTQSLLPQELIVEHDFSRGPWWPEETFDAVWCVEFLEHVARYIGNTF